MSPATPSHVIVEGYGNPLTSVIGASTQPAQAALAMLQAASVCPGPEPSQVQLRVVPQAVWPLSAVTLPAVQTPGVALQEPLTTQAALAMLQAASVCPGPEPSQVQLRVVPQAVWPLSAVTLPAVQTPGVALQEPLTVGSGAEQAFAAVLVPPPDPLQPQVHGPEPLTAVGVPVAQRLLEGATAVGVPLAVPQAPLTMGGGQSG